jgi:hypothetical protein
MATTFCIMNEIWGNEYLFSLKYLYLEREFRASTVMAILLNKLNLLNYISSILISLWVTQSHAKRRCQYGPIDSLLGLGSCFHLLRSLPRALLFHPDKGITTDLERLETDTNTSQLVPLYDMDGANCEFRILYHNVFVLVWNFKTKVSLNHIFWAVYILVMC